MNPSPPPLCDLFDNAEDLSRFLMLSLEEQNRILFLRMAESHQARLMLSCELRLKGAQCQANPPSPRLSQLPKISPPTHVTELQALSIRPPTDSDL